MQLRCMASLADGSTIEPPTLRFEAWLRRKRNNDLRASNYIELRRASPRAAKTEQYGEGRPSRWVSCGPCPAQRQASVAAASPRVRLPTTIPREKRATAWARGRSAATRPRSPRFARRHGDEPGAPRGQPASDERNREAGHPRKEDPHCGELLRSTPLNRTRQRSKTPRYRP